MQNKMTLDELKQKVFSNIVGIEISSYMGYIGGIGVSTTSDLLGFEPGVTRYRMRKILKELVADGVIEYVSVGCPALENDYHEWFCDAGPPINGYQMTDKGKATDAYKTAYAGWENKLKDMTVNFV